MTAMTMAAATTRDDGEDATSARSAALMGWVERSGRTAPPGARDPGAGRRVHEGRGMGVHAGRLVGADARDRCRHVRPQGVRREVRLRGHVQLRDLRARGRRTAVAGSPFEDPNMEYVNSLSPAEQEAYNAALYGDPSIWEGCRRRRASRKRRWWSPSSARPAGLRRARPGSRWSARTRPSDPEVQRMLDDFYQSQQDDPALDALVADWVECFQPKLDEYGIETTLEEHLRRLPDDGGREVQGARRRDRAGRQPGRDGRVLQQRRERPDRVRRRERCRLRRARRRTARCPS